MSQRARAYVQSLEHLLTEGEYAVAQALAQLARDDDDVAEATMAQIGDAAGMHARNSRKFIRRLEYYGLLVSTYEKKGLRRSRSTYTFVELAAARPKTGPDLATVISLSKAMRRKAEAMRQRADDQLRRAPGDRLLLADVYEEMARTLRQEAEREPGRAQGGG